MAAALEPHTYVALGVAANGAPEKMAGAGEKSVLGTGSSAGMLPAHRPVYFENVVLSMADSVDAPGVWSMLRYQENEAAVSLMNVRPAKPNDGSRKADHTGWLLWQK